jgi:hypothetical protein
MSMFHTNIQEIKREINSVLDVLIVLQFVNCCNTRIEEGCLSLKTQESLCKVKKDGLEIKAGLSVKEVCSVY